MQLPFIPYFQTTRYRVEAMIELAEIQPESKAADLGSGDGRIVIALAQAGAQATGYELDEKLVALSRENIQDMLICCHPERNAVKSKDLNNKILHYGNNDVVIPTILQKDFWEEDLGQYDIITVYPMPDIMQALEKKLQKELRPGARVLLNYYPFPNWKKTAEKAHIFLYKKS